MKIVCQAMHNQTGKRSDAFILNGDASDVLTKLFPDDLDNILIIPLLHIPADDSDPVISTLPIVSATQLISMEFSK